MHTLRSGLWVFGLMLSIIVVSFGESWGPQSRAVALYSHADAAASVLALQDAFRSLGVPFRRVRSLEDALSAPLIFVCGDIEGNAVALNYEKTLRPYLETGGVVVFENVTASDLGKLAGFAGAIPLRTRHSMKFTESVLLENTASLGSSQYPEVIWTVGYLPAGSEVLAQFDDGSAALLRHKVGKGLVYTIGAGWLDTILRPRQNRDFEAQRVYVNALDSSADLFLLLLQELYWKHVPNSIRLYGLPRGAPGLVILTHDVDWEFSVAPVRSFVEAEKKYGIRGTFFVQAKTKKDYNGPAVLTRSTDIQLMVALNEGADLESHSVSHSRWFNTMPAGTGTETSETYSPSATGFRTITGASVAGEVCVSKQRLEAAFSRQVVIFRAGHLRVPPTLPETLEHCGYIADSSLTAADVMTSVPYRLFKTLGFEEPTNIFEFPITVEDEQWHLNKHTQDVLDLVKVQGAIGAPTVILIHPTNATDKLEAETQILRNLPPRVSAADLKTFADFYIARWNIDWDDTLEGGLRLCSKSGIQGLTVRSKQDDRIVDIDPGECRLLAQPKLPAQ